MTTDASPGLLLFSGAVEEISDALGTATVELQIVHNGHEHPVPSHNTVSPGDTEQGLVFLQCDEQPGQTDVLLQARSTGAQVTIGPRNLAMAETVHLP